MRLFKLFISLTLVLLISGALMAREIGKNPRYALRYSDSRVSNLAFSSDSKRLVTVGWPDANLWEAGSGQLIKKLYKYGWRGTAVAYSSSGKYIATGGSNGKVSAPIGIWDGQSGAKIREIGAYSYVYGLSFSHNGTWIAVSGTRWADKKSQSGSVVIYVVENGEELVVLDKATSVFDAVAFSKDGRTLAVAIQNKGKGVKFYNVRQGKLQKHIQLKEEMTSLALSPDGDLMVAAGYSVGPRDSITGGVLYGFDPVTGKQKFRIGGIKKNITGVSFDPSGRYLAVAIAAGKPNFMVWDMQTRQLHYQNKRGRRPSEDIAFSPDGRMLGISIMTYGNLGNPATMEIYDSGTKSQLAETGASNDIKTFKKGKHVRARIKGKWYTGVVDKTGNGHYLLKMDDRKPEYWKWIKPGNLRPL